jgi:two-component system sensor histidine kinase and response regulator WspE
VSADHPPQFSLLALFRQEADSQTQVLTSGLLALERDPAAADRLDACMRAAHSLKGAARIIELGDGVRVAHAMEDCFVAAQQGRIRLMQSHIDLLLQGVDLLMQLAETAADSSAPAPRPRQDVEEWLAAMGKLPGTPDTTFSPDVDEPPLASPASNSAHEAPDRVLRVTAESLNRLLGLASESLVESRWVKPFGQSLLGLKRLHQEANKTFDNLRDTLSGLSLDEQTQVELAAAQRKLLECSQVLSQRLAELELFDQRSINLSHRLYDEALACRMRPFNDGVQAFPRIVRDVARSLGKEARLEISGEATQVDRDILTRLDAPLGHLLRNAVDHGLETPDERRAAGKPAEGLVRLEARHNAGALLVTVSDDGRGVDLESLRRAVVDRKLTTPEAAAALSDAEVLEFLFLPGFSMKGSLTEISGRGVGLDVVRDMVKQVHGTVHIFSQPGRGTTFRLQLPVTLSVLRTLLVDIGGEPFAFPLTSIVRALRLSKEQVTSIEHRQHFDLDGQHVGLVAARQVLDVGNPSPAGDHLPVVVIGDPGHTYGLSVDRFLGERELVVQPLDAQFGKVRNISSGALMEDGSPVLIVDTDDLIRSIDTMVSGGRLAAVQHGVSATGGKRRKRVLVVDDSLTVRELERKLLGNRGYDVEVAVDGMDGWNAVRSGHFDLVVTDIDMPRMDGIELVTSINKDPNLSLPVMIVSYKDREEDRRRGLEAGAAYYLTKSGFHDETLVQVVVDLIGEADA